MVDGQGIAHPRRMGLASHLGLCLGIPTIGCAKSRLCGECEEPANERGSYAELKDNGEVIGAVLRTRAGVKPVYVSIGHMIDLPSAIHWVVACCRGYRLPEPTRLAHQAAGGYLKVQENTVAVEYRPLNYLIGERGLMPDLKEKLKDLQSRVAMPWSIFDIAGKEKEIGELERQSAQPDFWSDQANAQTIMRQLAEKTRTVQRWRGLEKKLADIGELIAISGEDDPILGGDWIKSWTALPRKSMSMSFSWLSAASMMPVTLSWRYTPGRAARRARTGRRC